MATASWPASATGSRRSRRLTSTRSIKTDAPRPGFFDGLEIFNICDKANVEGPDAKTTIVGTGPFTLAERVPGDHFTFAKNKNYWQSGKPYLDGIVTNIRNAAEHVAAARGRSARRGQDPAYRRLCPTAQPIRNIVAQIAPNSGTFFEIGINTKTQPLDDKRVRQALNFALDRKRYAETIFQGAATPIDLPVERELARLRRRQEQPSIPTTWTRRGRCSKRPASGFETDILVIGIGASRNCWRSRRSTRPAWPRSASSSTSRTWSRPAWLDVVINKKPEYTGFWGSSDTSANVSPGSLFALSPGWRIDNNHSNFTDDTYTGLIATVSSETDPAKQKAAIRRDQRLHARSVVHDADQHQSDHPADDKEGARHRVPDAHRRAQLYQYLAGCVTA